MTKLSPTTVSTTLLKVQWLSRELTFLPSLAYSLASLFLKFRTFTKIGCLLFSHFLFPFCWVYLICWRKLFFNVVKFCSLFQRALLPPIPEFMLCISFYPLHMYIFLECQVGNDVPRNLLMGTFASQLELVHYGSPWKAITLLLTFYEDRSQEGD